jgi:hypothetical protein
MKSLYNSKVGAMDASKKGLGLALLAIFILGIGIPVTQQVIDDGNLSGLTATVVGFAPVIIGAGFLAMASKEMGLI